MTRSYKSFRREGFSLRPDVYDRNRNGEPLSSDEKENRDRDVEKESKEDFSSLLELRDVSDELRIIQKLFKEQRDTLGDMAAFYRGDERPPGMHESTLDLASSNSEGLHSRTGNLRGSGYLRETEQILNDFDKHVSEMIEDATNAEKAVRMP